MSAPKRTRQHTRKTVYLSPRQTPDPPKSFRSRVLNYAGAKCAFEELTLPGPNEDMFWRHLWGLASLAKAEQRKKQAVPWYSLPGFPSHTARRFPAKVRGWADEIERLGKAMQSHQLWGAIMQFLPEILAEDFPSLVCDLRVSDEMLKELGAANPPVSEDHARRVFQTVKQDGFKPDDLPSRLRAYADYVEVVAKVTVHHASKAPAFLSTQMELALADFVRTATGKPHWDEIATLLTAAYDANGCDVEVDPRALQMQYSRRKK